MKMMMKNQKEKHPKTRKGIRGEKKNKSLRKPLIKNLK